MVRNESWIEIPDSAPDQNGAAGDGPWKLRLADMDLDGDLEFDDAAGLENTAYPARVCS